MKLLTSIIVLMSFLGMMAFGAYLLEHSMMRHSDCIASVIVGGLCPESYNGIFLHHVAALQTFFASLPSISGAMMIFLLLFSLTVLLADILRSHLPPQSRFAYSRGHGNRHGFFGHSFLYWLALFEHSPSA